MTSQEAEKLVLDYVYGELPKAVAREFEAVLERDEGLRSEVESLREVRSAAAGLEPVRLPTEVRKRLLKAAKRRSASRAFLDSDILTMVERFFLSPAFTGALVVVVALGVGINLIMETGLEDRITRLENGERESIAKAPTPQPAEQEKDEAAAAPAVPATVSGPKADSPVDEPVASGGAKMAKAKYRKQADRRARARDEGRPAPKPARPSQAPTPKKVATGWEDGLVKGDAGAGGSVARGRFAASAGRAGPAGAPASAPAMDMAEAEAVAEGPVATKSVSSGERNPLDTARTLRAKGELEASLDAFLETIEGGLEGETLKDALYEAAEVAIELGKPGEARRLIDRLETLPGGKDRARPLVDRLDKDSVR